MPQTTAEKIKNRLLAMENEVNKNWLSSWKDISKYILPLNGRFPGEIPNSGEKINHSTLLNGHPTLCARILAAGMTSGLTSPARPWFKLGIEDEELMRYTPVKLWLEEIEKRMMTVFSRSNFYECIYSIYEEIGSFGTGCGIIVEDYKTIIRCYNFTAGEYFLGMGGDNRINSLGRKYWKTVGQLVDEFGIENVSEQTRSMYNSNKIDNWRECAQIIEPNDTRIPDIKSSNNKPFRSFYWEIGSQSESFLMQSGFDTFPVIAPRWHTKSGSDIYGKGPGWEALGDAKMLQRQEKDKLLAIEKVNNPPLQVDSSIEQVNVLPGGITRYSGAVPNAGVRSAYQISPDINSLRASIQDTMNEISRFYFNDIFLMISNSDDIQKTAAEIYERHEEKMVMLGPVINRLVTELLDPAIERTFDIMFKSGLIPEPPREIQGMSLNVTYISILAQAQKAVEGNTIQRAVGYAVSLAPVNPNILDVINMDESIIQYAYSLGVSPKIIRSEEEIAQIRNKRQQAEQMQQMAQNSMMAADGAKTLADTKLGEGNALDRVVSGVTGNQ